jgi:AcrR family transcriptional regulator
MGEGNPLSSAAAGPGEAGDTSTAPEPATCEPPLRADARRNRAQILAAAESLFAEEGVGVPIDDVARRAGVGVGTLYRHFPTKEALFEAVIVTHMQRLTVEARALAGADDPGRALFEFLGRMAEEASAKRDLFDALSGAGINVKAAAAGTKHELEEAARVLLERAQHAGSVRGDVSLADLIGLVMGTCLAAESEAVSCSQGRMMQIVCAGLRAEATAASATAATTGGTTAGTTTGSTTAGATTTAPLDR